MDDHRRYYGLDALRGSMMLLGIVLHGSQWYITRAPAGLPMPSDPSTSYLFDLIVHFVHSFRMPLFFLVAGFFAALLMDKRGLYGTLANRGKRVLAPLLLSCVTILPVTALFMIAFLVSARFGTQQLVPTPEQADILRLEIEAAGLPTNQPSLAHLWFLYYLLFFYLTLPICRILSTWSRKNETRVAGLIGSPWFMLVLAAITTMTLWPFHGGAVYEGFLFIKPHAPSLIYYGSFFVCGYLLHAHRSALPKIAAGMHLWLIASLLLFPLAVHTTELAMDHHAPWAHGLAVLANALLTWSLIYLFLGVFLRLFDRASPWTIYVSNSSYWVYLIHLPLISFAAWFMLPFDLHAFAKFPLIVAFTTIASFASYHYLVQRSWVSVLLSGMRFDQPWPWQETARPQAPAPPRPA